MGQIALRRIFYSKLIVNTMEKPTHLLLIVAALFPLVLKGQGDYQFKWSEAFKFETPDKAFSLKFGGRIHYDMAWFKQDEELETRFGDKKSGTEFRRVRFYNQGTVYKTVNYKLQLEFAGGEIGFKDVYIEYTGIPYLGALRAGQMKEPFRLEVIHSSNPFSFMERSFVTSFSPERNTGLLVHNSLFDGRVDYQAGVFRNANGVGNDVDAGDSYNFTARLTGLILEDPERNSLLHLGLAFSNRKNESGTYGISARPASHLAPKYVSTGTLTNVDRVALSNLELAWIAGPLSVQSEYLRARIDNDGPDFNFSAYYAQVSYFLTGESFKWKGSYEGFDKVVPHRNVGEGPGAWEVALRFDAIDLDDRVILGGKMSQWTLAVNWFLNPASRIMFNYVLADVEGLGKSIIFQTRFQVIF